MQCSKSYVVETYKNNMYPVLNCTFQEKIVPGRDLRLRLMENTNIYLFCSLNDVIFIHSRAKAHWTFVLLRSYECLATKTHIVNSARTS